MGKIKVKKEKNFELKKQDILTGSRVLNSNTTKNRIEYFIDNVESNLSYILEKKNLNKKKELCEKFIKYRNLWKEQPLNIINDNNTNFKDEIKKIRPLCIDLEVASICDLACPHCFREYLATPDKIIDINLAKKIIDQAAEIGVYSIKFNWRGEPLLNPKLPELIYYSKKKGIIETIINTKATNLKEKKSQELIDHGLDYMIYSFDGGVKSTYEKLRPGRFKKNSFERVIKNIQNFKKIREKNNAKFPYTKIQMVLMESNRNELDEFHKLFQDHVDEVTVTLYSERGGKVTDLPEKYQKILKQYLEDNNLSRNTPYMLDGNNNLFISKKRKACGQIFQRMMVTYDGRVGMCCMDWGAKHNLGYLSEKGFNHKDEEKKIIRKVQNKENGFELLKDIKIPEVFNDPKKDVSTLSKIWSGENLNNVRNDHINNRVDQIEICKGCNSRDTFEWVKIA